MGERMKQLYPEQTLLLDKSRRTGKRSVLIQAATGFGKSVIAAHIVHGALSKGSRTIFTVPRIELLKQMSQHYLDFGIEHTFIAGGKYKYNARVNNIIATVPSLVRRLDKIVVPDLIIIDETHFGSDALGKIIKWAKANGVFILGLSATPWRSDGKGLGCWYDAMVEGPSVKWLIKNGFLSDYRLFAPDTIDLKGIRTTAGDYNKKDLSERMESNRVLVGNVVKHYKEHAMGLRGVTFTVSRKHSQIVCDAFNSEGVPAACIDGETPPDERKRLAIALATGEILQLVNAELLTFGYDLAAAAGIDVTIECMSDLQPTKSLAKQSQKWGRVLRKKDNPAIIFDHANNVYEHDFPDDDREWTLDDRVKKTKKQSDERDIAVKVCTECFKAHKPAPHCPECGFVYPVQYREIKEEEGELKEIERVRVAKVKRMEVGRCKTQAELESIADERGYLWQWVKRQCKIKHIPYRPRTLPKF